MRLYIGHRSAYEQLLAGGWSDEEIRTAPHAGTIVQTPASSSSMQDICLPRLLGPSHIVGGGARFVDSLEESPVHLYVPDRESRIGARGFTCHVCTGDLPRNSFFLARADGLGNELYLATPELCFIQMAKDLPLASRILLGMEMTGTYGTLACSWQGTAGRSAPPRPIPDEPTDRLYTRARPLTTPHRIASFADAAAGMRGVENARKAVGHVCAYSASPMESALTMLLSLPPRLGGFGFEKPVLNHKLELSRQQRRMAGKQFYRADLFWPDKSVDVEYDSDSFHTGPERIAADSQRRNVLSYIGVQVLTVTRQELYSELAFEHICIELARKLGRRLRPPTPAQAAARTSLRQAVLLQQGF